MKYYVIDDSQAVVMSVVKMIETREFGRVVGSSTSPIQAEQEIVELHPDIVLVDYLMEEMSGVELVKRVKMKCPDICFVMLSKVADKKMVGNAYDAGIEFFMSKPISILEAQKVLGNVAEHIKMKRVISSIYGVIGDEIGTGGKVSQVSRGPVPTSTGMTMGEKMHRVDILLGAIDMRTQKGTVFIKQLIEIMCERGCDYSKDLLEELSERNDITMKNLEQQIRRAIKKGLETSARIGLNDFDNEAFVVYAGYVFDYACVREEMNHIKDNSIPGGRVSIGSFMDGLKLYVECTV